MAGLYPKLYPIFPEGACYSRRYRWQFEETGQDVLRAVLRGGEEETRFLVHVVAPNRERKNAAARIGSVSRRGDSDPHKDSYWCGCRRVRQKHAGEKEGAQREEGRLLFEGGIRGIAEGTLVFSPDGKRLAYGAPQARMDHYAIRIDIGSVGFAITRLSQFRCYTPHRSCDCLS